MIIIEGADMTGKTSLCKDIELNAGLLYQHISKPPGSWPVPQGYIDLVNQHTVRDRFHLSDIAYKLATKNRLLLTAQTLDIIEAHLTMVGCFTVVITAEDCLLEQRFAKLQEREMYDLETILKANLQYKNLVDRKTTLSQHCNINYHIHCDKHKLWPTAEDLMTIISLYHEKLQCLEDALS